MFIQLIVLFVVACVCICVCVCVDPFSYGIFTMSAPTHLIIYCFRVFCHIAGPEKCLHFMIFFFSSNYVGYVAVVVDVSSNECIEYVKQVNIIWMNSKQKTQTCKHVSLPSILLDGLQSFACFDLRLCFAECWHYHFLLPQFLAATWLITVVIYWQERQWAKRHITKADNNNRCTSLW